VTQRLLSRPLGRCIGLDVHVDFIEIAICEEGQVWSRPSALASGSWSTTRSPRSSTSKSAASVAWSRTITRTAASHAIWLIVRTPAPSAGDSTSRGPPELSGSYGLRGVRRADDGLGGLVRESRLVSSFSSKRVSREAAKGSLTALREVVHGMPAVHLWGGLHVCGAASRRTGSSGSAVCLPCLT
jgi:hypothetical protein